jgi:hypothetical protein
VVFRSLKNRQKNMQRNRSSKTGQGGELGWRSR